MSGEEPNKQDDLSQDDIDAAFAAAGGDASASGDEGGAGAAPDAAADAASDAAAESAEAQTSPEADAPADADETPAPEPAEAAEAAATDASEATAAADESPEPPDEGGPFSQDQIDAALAGEAGDDAPTDAASEPVASVPESDAGAGGSMTQDDIDAAMAAAEETVANETPAAAGNDEEDSSLAQSGEVKLDSAGRPFDDAAAMMEAAIAEERAAAAQQAAQPPPPPPAGSTPVDMPDLSSVATDGSTEQSIELLNDVELDVKIELGRAQMLIEDVLRLGSGSVVELDKLAGDPVDVFVNERLVARGEVIVLNENFCVRINEIVAAVEEEELV